VKVRTVESGRLPAWSPDATRIVYTGAEGGLFVVGAQGGAPHRVADTAAAGVWSPDGQRIAYSDGFGVSVLRAEGGGSGMLAPALEIPNDSLPSWSPDGKDLVVAARLDSESTGLSVYMIDAQTGVATRLVAGSQPKWSPREDRIAFVREGAIALIRPDGTNLRTVTTPAPGAGDSYPSWSPDRRRLAFVRSKPPTDSKTSQIGVANITRGDVRLLTPSSGNSVQGYPRGPAWSADGRTIFYSSSSTHHLFHLFTVSQDMRRLRQLTHGAVDDHDPAWAPDGRRLAFVRNGKLLELRSASRIHPLVRARGLSSPTWSPDGKRLAYATTTGIWLINDHGGGRTRLANGSNPAWSPAGRWIAYQRNDGLHVVRTDGRADQVVVAATENRVPVAPTWSGNGRILYYVEEHPCDWQCAPSGVLRGLRPFTLPRTLQLPEIPAENPSLSPNGRSFVFDGLTIAPRSGFGTIFRRQSFATETEPDWQRLTVPSSRGSKSR
jgi:Tol biopolymer transport system component